MNDVIKDADVVNFGVQPRSAFGFNETSSAISFAENILETNKMI